jgi:hypothetical protein
VTRAPRAFAFAAVVAPLALALGGCSSCKKTDEPARDTKFNPTSDASSKASPSATPSVSAGAKYTPFEQREMRVRIDNELCENAAKRWNTLNNRPPTDPAGIDVLSTCLKHGNNAWYRCILEAPAPEAYHQCSVRLLLPPDETR